MIGPLSISNEATKIYSTWFSTSPRGYWDRSFLLLCASGLYLRIADKDECCDETPLEGVFEFELGSDVWSVSIIGGLGLLEGRECLADIAEGERLEGNDDRDVLRLTPTEPLELEVVRLSVTSAVPLVVGRCMAMAILVTFVLW